jgi:hypothetical protein
MTTLDVADLVVIASRTLGLDSDAALAELDLVAAGAALAEGGLTGSGLPDEIALAAVRLMRALLAHRPFARSGEQVAVAAGLQFLSLNGWRADLDPPATAAVVIEALAAGQLSPESAAAWLSPRLHRASARPLASHRVLAGLAAWPGAVRLTASRLTATIMLALALSGLAVLAAACASAPGTPATHPVAHATTRHPAHTHPR